MNQLVILREYGVIAYSGNEQGLDRAVISKSAWEWLKRYMLLRRGDTRELIRPVIRYGVECLQVRNYVGVLETPCGTRIEVLPKITKDSDQSASESRKVLYKMLSKVMSLPWISAMDTSLKTFDRPLIEILIARFLGEVVSVVQRGIRSDYVRKLEHAKYLRGSLQVSRQLREHPTRQSLFWVEYDEYQSNRSENRLIHSSLKKILKWSRSPENLRLARELYLTFADIPPSTNYKHDIANWSHARDMVHYQPLLPWCKLILQNKTPFSLPDKWEGVSMLFPMEVLFEKYVYITLRNQLKEGYKLRKQVKGKYLTTHKNNGWFQLQPDLLIEKLGEPVTVLDTKWKLVNEELMDTKNKYNLSQSDFYQLFAYGKKYLNGNGIVYLIYPSHSDFKHPLDSFIFDEGLKLKVIPFDFKTNKILFDHNGREAFDG